MNGQSVISRFRLFGLGLALALTIAAVVTTPATADVMAEGTWTCEDGCWAWNERTGCTQPVTCCSNTDGRWFCHQW